MGSLVMRDVDPCDLCASCSLPWLTSVQRTDGESREYDCDAACVVSDIHSVVILVLPIYSNTAMSSRHFPSTTVQRRLSTSKVVESISIDSLSASL
jgi:hypothetical protein